MMNSNQEKEKENLHVIVPQNLEGRLDPVVIVWETYNDETMVLHKPAQQEEQYHEFYLMLVMEKYTKENAHT